MGSAILTGLIRNQIAKPRQVWVHDAIHSRSLSVKKKFGVGVAKSNSDLVRRTDVILLAMKPQDLHQIGSDIKRDLRKGHVVISILAGTPITKLKRFLGTHAVVVRAMPNLGAQVGKAITAITSTNQGALYIARSIFLSCGEVIGLPEKHFDLVTAVSGSGPAYFFLLMELLVQVAERGGIGKKEARLLAVQTALGAAKLASLSALSPQELRKQVTSKKGTTDAALRFLAKRGFSNLFISAVRRAVQRARELNQL